MKTAIVLAGGLGTRLHTITKDLIPKPMVLVQKRPFLYWILKYLKTQDIQKVILAVSHHAHTIVDHFGYDYEDLCLDYSIEKSPLGTGGAIWQAWQLVKEDSVTIINGDTYFPIDLVCMTNHHMDAANDVTIGIKMMKNFDRYGAASIDQRNIIHAFGEKKWKAQGYINGGIYMMNRSVLSGFKIGQPFSLEREIFEKKASHLQIGGYKSRRTFIDIGIPEDYHRIQTLSLK